MPTPSTARMHDFEVVSNQEIADGIFSLVISAPKLASALKPGQFVEVEITEFGEHDLWGRVI